MKRSIVLLASAIACFLPGIMAALLALTAVSAHATLFTVDAMVNSSGGGIGLNTGITLSSGEVFTVSAGINDLWSAGALPRFSNADGLVGDLFATGSDESGQAAGTKIGQNFGLLNQNGLSAPFGTLVGDISGTFFKLGTNFSGAAPATGTLLLFYWDSNSGDNSGSVVADVRTGTAAPGPSTAVPEPGSSMLLCLGLFIGLITGWLRYAKSSGHLAKGLVVR